MKVIVLFIFCAIIQLLDASIISENVVSLDGTWKASNGAGTVINGTVPGDLITDLHKSGLIPEPLYETTWIDQKALWNEAAWTYATSFQINATDAVDVLLVFDGVKMGANLSFNGNPIGYFGDQFVRYNFSILSLLTKDGSPNQVQVTFPSGGGADAFGEGRYMACSAGWDWAPMSANPAILSKGIWKSVYVVVINSAAITDIVTQVFYNGTYPTSPLADLTAAFTVVLNIHMYAPKETSGTLGVLGDWAGAAASGEVDLPAGISVQRVVLTANTVMLWWPNGLGEQNHYNVSVVFKATSNGGILTDKRRIGFRVFAVVTDDDSDPTKLVGLEGAGNLTMRFRINGANIYVRGANFIPMEDFEGRNDPVAMARLVRSVSEANMNIMRIWGGGIFQYDEFYDACDEYGIMLYHDMMYTENFYPAATPLQDSELRHNIRRLVHHPSIVMWDSCNECPPGGLYDTFVMDTVIQEDRSRPVWPSCPSSGYSAGTDRLYGLPNGNPLVSVQTSTKIEVHGPYFGGSGWPSVDGNYSLSLPGTNIPPPLATPDTPIDPYIQGFFTSEFGAVVISSFESMIPLLEPKDWSLHSPPMYQRNQQTDGFITQFWGPQNLSEVGSAFMRQLYQSMIGQAIFMKGKIESMRSFNTYGTIIWQLNEIWPTGGWGSLEYATSSVDGQVVGGRWKPLHYLLKKSIYTDQIASCGANGACYFRNDGPMTSFAGELIISALHFSNGSLTLIRTTSVYMKSGAGIMEWMCLQEAETNVQACTPLSSVLGAIGCDVSGKDCALNLTIVDDENKVVSQNIMPLATPADMSLPEAIVSFTITNTSKGGAEIELTSSNVAMYVVLTTLANGRFSDNAFAMLPYVNTVVKFIPFGDLDLPLLQESLRVEHVQMYQ